MVSLLVEAIPGDPCPRVGITVRGLTAGIHRVTVWRTCEGDRVAVTGARLQDVVDSAFFEDYAAPLNRPIMYHLEVVSGPDAMTVVPGAGVTLASVSGYLQDPLDPGSAVPINAGPHGTESFLEPESFASLNYASSISSFGVMGSDRPVAIAGRRQAATGVPMSLIAVDRQQNDRLRSLIRQAPLIIMRPLPGWGQGLPASATYAASSFEERNLRHAIGGQLTRWVTTGDVVRSGSSRVLIPTWTFQKVRDLFSTFEQKQIRAGGGTFLDDMKNPAN